MVAQITDRVRHFLSEPVSVQVTVARNNSLIYPAITICNKVRFYMLFWSENEHIIFTEYVQHDSDGTYSQFFRA